MEPRRKSARNQKPDPPPEPTPPKQVPTREKRKHTPVKEKTVPPPKSATPAPPPLPTKLAPGQSIPELKDPQPVDLPDSEWQTVTESGVLKAALERSRQKWMTPGIFELYYSKAGKKRLPGHKEREKEKELNKGKDKGENEPEEKDSVKAKQMKREGNCKLYIDPHQWDITVWTMRDNTVPPPPKPKPPTHQPANYGNQGQYHGGYAASHPFNYQSSYNAAPKHPPPPPKQTPNKPPQPPQPARPTPTHPANETNTPAPKPAPDPVIHMLAERANTNYKLRDVMKIVARGEANKEQLEYFQCHITELNQRLEAQKKAQAQAQAQRAQPPLPARPSATAHIVSATPPGTPGRNTPVPPRSGNAPPPTNPSMSSTATSTPAKPTPSASAPPNMPQQPPMTYYTPPPQPSPFGHYPPPQPPTSAAPTPTPAPPPQHQQRPAQPPPQQQPQPVQPPPIPQPTYRALCIDFNTNGDRLLFPRETILEALPGNQVLASFLKVQKIDLAAMNTLTRSNTYYQALKEYYQPVTVRFRADNPAILACLWRWVKPADQVRKHMDEVMDRCLPAEEVEIAARLPREGTKAALGERDASTPRESVERVGTPAEGRDRKRAKKIK